MGKNTGNTSKMRTAEEARKASEEALKDPNHPTNVAKAKAEAESKAQTELTPAEQVIEKARLERELAKAQETVPAETEVPKTDVPVVEETAKTEIPAETEVPKTDVPVVEETAKTEVPAETETPKAEDVPKADETAKADETPKDDPKPTKVLEPKKWQRISDDGKSLIDQITYLGEKKDYIPPMKGKYRFGNLDPKDGMERVVTAKFPKSEAPEESKTVNYKGYNITLDKYGASIVCSMNNLDGTLYLQYVALSVVLDVLQDELNPGKTCETNWGTIDQSIKYLRGLNSRIKALDENGNVKRSSAVKAEEKAAKIAEDVKNIEAEVQATAEANGTAPKLEATPEVPAEENTELVGAQA